MSREEEINAAADKAMEELWTYGVTYSDGFRHGARWADAHPHWISVDDRRPKLKHMYEDTQCSDKVIVTNGEYRTSASWVHSIWAGWYGWFTDGDEELKDVTHWMPLPSPPHHIIDANKMVKKGGEE